MQVTPNFMEAFYPILVQKASIVVSSCIVLPPRYVKELAHDLVVDFFLSNSLKNTYNPEKGKIEPYFGSYAYRKMQGWRDRMGNKNEVSLFAVSGVSDNFPSSDPSVEEKFEMKNYISMCEKWLTGKYYVYGKTGQKKIDLYRLFNLCIASWVNFGEVQFPWLRKHLKCSYPEVKKAVETMKRLVSTEEERCGITFG